MLNTLVFFGGDVVTPFRTIRADVVVREGRILDIRPHGPLLAGETAVDCRGLYVGPGLVDIHVHGGAGHDFASDDPAAIVAGAEYHLGQGTTSLAPSG